MLTETRRMPTSCIRCTASGVIRVPFGESATLRPFSVAWAAMSNTSGRIRGSPPLMTKIGLEKAAI